MRNTNSVNIAVIGVSGRGHGMMCSLLDMPDVHITAVCDVYEDRMRRAAETVAEKRGITPFFSLDYRDVLARDDVDGVLITTSWQTHIRIAIDAMNAGKYVASEVGGAASVEECWDMVRTSERTGMPCMLLENCCYGRRELGLLNMVRKGLFGELVHCRGGYLHDLRGEVGRGHVNRHYRLDNYMHRNGDIYPTHGAVPMGKILNINRGNRFVNLVSMSTKAVGMNAWFEENPPVEEPFLKDYAFAQGDVVTTMIRCAHGETLVLTHDTTLPRPYSRSNYVQGTRGVYMEENNSIFIEGVHERHRWHPFDDLLKEHEHPIWQRFLDEGVRGGHGGMDYLVLRSYIESIQAQSDTPIDVYDFATYAAITALSEQSIAAGSAPQPFPDFTNGRYLIRPDERVWHYALSAVCEDVSALH